jgi:hypothetical protein
MLKLRGMKSMRFLPTWPRQRVEPILHTYGGGNGRRRVGDGGVVQSILHNSEGGLWGFSGDGKSNVGGGGLQRCSWDG